MKPTPAMLDHLLKQLAKPLPSWRRNHGQDAVEVIQEMAAQIERYRSALTVHAPAVLRAIDDSDK